MWVSEGGTPVSTTDRENGELGNDDGGADSSSDFLGGLDPEANMSLTVTDNNDSLETGTLTSTSLLLDRFNLFSPKPNSLVPDLANHISYHDFNKHYLHNLILQFGQEEVDDLILLDGQRVEVDLLHTLYLSKLN